MLTTIIMVLMEHKILSHFTNNVIIFVDCTGSSLKVWEWVIAKFKCDAKLHMQRKGQNAPMGEIWQGWAWVHTMLPKPLCNRATQFLATHTVSTFTCRISLYLAYAMMTINSQLHKRTCLWIYIYSYQSHWLSWMVHALLASPPLSLQHQTLWTSPPPAQWRTWWGHPAGGEVWEGAFD